MRRYKKHMKRCYYCYGSGKSFSGHPCSNCKGEGRKIGKDQLMRCWGGPHAGKLLTAEDAGPGYIWYNPASNRRQNPYPCVLIHEDVLNA